VPAAVAPETASPAIDRLSFLSVVLGGSVPGAGGVVRALHVDDDTAIDDDGDDASLVLDGGSTWSAARIPHGRLIAALASRVCPLGVRIGIEIPRAPPFAPPIV
jgi:hypothetical protein